MGPDELDDLLGSIRAESKRESALALYEGTRETDLVDEEVDERILRSLGLEDVFDIDYGTYITLLKERLASSRSFGKQLSAEEDEMLIGEYKRIRGKVGRFKIKRKNITAENIGATGPIKVSSNKFLLAGKAVVPEPSAGKDSDDIKGIEKALDNILKTLTLQNKEKKKSSEDERKKSEDRKRKKRENDLEAPLSQLKSLAKKIIAPAQGILDRIFRFIKFTLLGYAFNQLVNWFSDPKNAEKIKVLGRFLKDWWPALALAYGLFATPFGKFVRGTLKMLRTFIPQLIKLARAHPVLALATAATVGGIAKIKESERMKPLTQKAQKEIDTTLSSKETPWYKKLGASFANQSLNAPGGPKNPMGMSIPGSMYNGGGQVEKLVDVKDIAFEGGGGITNDSGLKVRGAGPDTQLIAAAPGEVVMSKKAVDKYGANFFLGLNKKAGGTNIPKLVNNIQLAQGGGMVGTGRVMQPSTGGNFRLGSGGRYPGMSQFKLLGMPIPFTQRRENFSGGDIRRYNRQGGSRSIETMPNYTGVPGTTLHRTTPRPQNFVKPIVPSASSSRPSFMQNVQIIRDAAKRQEVEMRKLGVKPDGYVNLRGQPMNLGPQSSARPPGPPVVYTKTTYTVLPPIKSPSKTPAIARGSKIPEFIISSENDVRSKIASTLGIADLVGVS
jgi:hypothetical protein